MLKNPRVRRIALLIIITIALIVIILGAYQIGRMDTQNALNEIIINIFPTIDPDAPPIFGEIVTELQSID